MHFAGLEAFKCVSKVSCRSMGHKSTLSSCEKSKIVVFKDQGLSARVTEKKMKK